MAKLPSPEECGRKILEIFVQDNIRPGKMIMRGSLHPRFLDKGYTTDDFRKGSSWLMEQGCITIKKDKPDMIFLTEIGFDMM